MSGLRGLPPGRAGRLWLARRLGTADHVASLLDRKLRILEGERRRFVQRADQATASWAAAIAEAETWALRAALLAGTRALDPVDGGRPAEVELDWAALMGARYPSAGRVALASAARSPSLPASAAVDEAARAYRVAARLAVEAAVARSAARVVGAEVEATQFRKRAVEDRWRPRLAEAADRLDLALSEAESAENVQRRLASRARDGEPAAHLGAPGGRTPTSGRCPHA